MSIARLEGSYTSLFTVPSRKIALVSSLCISLVFTLLEVMIRNVEITLQFLTNIFVSFLLLIFTFPLFTTFLLKTEETTLQPNRRLWTSSFSLILSAPFYFIGILFRYSTLSVFFILIGLGMKFYWDLLATYSLSDISTKKALSITLPGVLFFTGVRTLFPSWGLLTHWGGILVLLTIVIFTLAVLGLIKFVNFVIGLQMNVKGIELFRGFVFAWLDQERELLENVLEQISVRRRLPIYLTLFKGETYKGVWIVPTVHPGPLLNIGSSDMIKRLSSKLRNELKAPVMIFHGTCTHSENLTSLAEQNKLSKLILKNIDQAELVENISPPVKIKTNDISIFSQCFGERAYFSISRSPKPMDDITFEVGKTGSLLSEKEGVEGVLIDTHNSIGLERKEGRKVEMNDPLSMEILAGVRNAIATLKTVPNDQKEKEIEFGIGQASGGLTRSEGVGSTGIKVAILGLNDKNYAYILLDSNNLQSGLREVILNALENEFKLEEGEVYTSDTHVVNATGSEGGYPLINEKVKDKLLKEIKIATREALNQMEKVSAYNLKVTGEMKVQGDESESALVRFGNSSVQIFKAALIVSLLPAFLATLCTSFLPILSFFSFITPI